MKTKQASLLRYPGGKARFAPFIEQVLQANEQRATVLAEPFCGGAGVSLALLEAGAVKRVALNDADPLVSALWQCVFSPADADWLAEQVISIPLDIDEWKRQKALEPASLRERALKALYLNRTSFNGIIHRAGPVGGWGQTKRTVGARFNRYKLVKRITELSKLHKQVEVYNEGWREFMLRMADRKRVCFYLDPPYYYKAEQLYGHIFTEAQHIELRDYLQELKLPWLLSYDDVQEVRALYDTMGVHARVVDNTYSTHPMGGASFVGREVFYTNLEHMPAVVPAPHIGLTVRHVESEPSAFITVVRPPVEVPSGGPSPTPS